MDYRLNLYFYQKKNLKYIYFQNKCRFQLPISLIKNFLYFKNSFYWQSFDWIFFIFSEEFGKIFWFKTFYRCYQRKYFWWEKFNRKWNEIWLNYFCFCQFFAQKIAIKCNKENILSRHNVRKAYTNTWVNRVNTSVTEISNHNMFCYFSYSKLFSIAPNTL